MKSKKWFVGFIGLYMFWSFKELVFNHYPNAILASFIVKLIVWVLPVFVYLKFIDKTQNPISYLKLDQNIFKGISWGIIISLGMLAVQGSIAFAIHGKLHFNLGWRWLTTFLFALPEEVLFRGFLLQKISELVKFAKANLYTSLLFVSIHFPVWFITGVTIPKFIFSVVSVFAVGYGLGYVLKKTNSLWSPIIVHTVFNLLLYTRG